MAAAGCGSHSAAALEEGREMSERLNQTRAAECLEDFYGVDGDGLGEGEAVCEEDLDLVWHPRCFTAELRVGDLSLRFPRRLAR